ncbi:DNA polymerase III subunit delta [Dongia rigui]|uniref:DNA-directed DNA polymerase n=1 Tax=Dongia rigui TaxID=940149 RepID=A0ABU5DXZ1_9PROT|nr:DNA polymerase III subunit delta [Dongia rigui]MDY0872145.1 DNA polymerase III subunit delta [Dongia rigui]
MKLDKQPLEKFLKEPAGNVAAALVFGPDEGMVHERAMAMSRAILGDMDDPFRLTELTGDEIKADPARLIDEARAIAMMGGRRVVRVTRVSDTHEPAFAALLADHKDSSQCLVVIEAGDIGGKSSLKRLFENAPHAAAIACYRDEAAALPALITQHLKAAGLEIDRDAVSYLAANLGGDRGITRAELDKLVLYMGAERKVSLDDAMANVGDQSAVGQDDLCTAIGLGDLKGLERQIERNLAESNEISLIRAVARHFMKLHQVTARVARGEQLEAAMAGLRPPVFWKAVDGFKAQCRRWPADIIGQALLRLAEIEAEAMRQHQFADTLTRRGLMEIAAMAGKR